MAYDLHIEESQKTLEQWIQYVEQAPGLDLIDVVSVTNPVSGELIEISTPNAARAENGAVFLPRVIDGRLTITVSSPDEATIELMKRIAADFGGRVIGDEGEEY